MTEIPGMIRMRRAMVQSTWIAIMCQFCRKKQRNGELHQHAINLLGNRKKAQETIIHDLVNSEDGNKHILAIAFYPDTENYNDI